MSRISADCLSGRFLLVTCPEEQKRQREDGKL